MVELILDAAELEADVETKPVTELKGELRELKDKPVLELER